MSVAPMRLEADIVPLLRPFAEVCRRKSRRFLFPVQSPGLLIFPKDGVTLEVRMHDISEHGIGFCSTNALPVGTPIVLTLKHPTITPFSLRATVAHATEIGLGDWRIGCEFAVPITPELLETML